ncbi:MAG: NAD(+)/NADH kinase [Treponema sp.]|jgi:NAD+ kinase|nr:NAD(+)/NADH kinase [Treponema sp.]
MKTIRRVLLIVNLHKKDAAPLAEQIVRVLEKRGLEVSVFGFNGKPERETGNDFDIAFSLGGDGTVLYAAREMAPFDIPILPINLGTLGFIAAVHPDEWEQVFAAYLDESVCVSERLMLDIWVERGDKEVFRCRGLNDAVITSDGISKIIRLHVGGDKIKLGHYRSDGLIVATPTGSTAYSVAAGGPILDPEMEAVILNPICPFTLSNRPIVVPSHEIICVEIEAEQRSGVLLTVDGQVVEHLEPRDKVYIQKAPNKAKLIASDRTVFYTVLRSKLNWSGGPDA